MNAINQEEVQGQARNLAGKIKETWGRLTDDDVALMNGKRDQFFGKLEEKYGLAKDEAEKRLKEIEASFSSSSSSKDESEKLLEQA